MIDRLIPYLAVDRARVAIAFYRDAFDARIENVVELNDGTITHAEVHIGDVTFSVREAIPKARAKPPKSLGGTTVTLTLYATDVDEMFDRCVGGGARIDTRPSDSYWGERYAQITDPAGHGWTIATTVSTVSTEEQRTRANQYFGTE